MSDTDINQLRALLSNHLERKGSSKKFVGTIYSDINTLNKILDYFTEEYIGKTDVVVAIDGSGYIIGSMVSRELGVGFIPVVKESTNNDFGDEYLRAAYIDHRDKPRSLVIRKDLFEKGQNVLIVDNWIESGVTIRALLSILEEAEVHVAGIVTYGINDNPNTHSLKEDFQVTAIVEE